MTPDYLSSCAQFRRRAAPLAFKKSLFLWGRGRCSRFCIFGCGGVANHAFERANFECRAFFAASDDGDGAKCHEVSFVVLIVLPVFAGHRVCALPVLNAIGSWHPKSPILKK